MQNMTAPSATELGSLLERLVYSFSSRMCLLFVDSFFLTEIVLLLLLISGAILLCSNYPGVEKKTHLDLNALEPCRTCISNLNLLNWEYIKFRPMINCSLFLNVDTQSLTYNIQNIDKRIPSKNLL